MASLKRNEIETLMNDDYEGDMSTFKKSQPSRMGSGRQDSTRSAEAKEKSKSKKAPKTLEEAEERRERNEKINAAKKLNQQKAVAAKQAEKSGANMDEYSFKPKKKANYGKPNNKASNRGRR